MHPSPPILDPEGHYARLGIVASASAKTIAAAYRRQARIVHPDVPGNGNAAAFVALRRAYDVLGDVGRRAAYDRAAVSFLAASATGARPDGRRGEGSSRPRDDEPGEIDPVPYPDIPPMPTRHPRLRDLPVYVWAGMAALLTGGLVEVGLHLRSPSGSARRESVPAQARGVPSAAFSTGLSSTGSASSPTVPGSSEAISRYGPAPVRLAGAANYYTVPAVGPTVLWRADEMRPGLVPWGQLPPFSAVQGTRLDKATGMMEVRVTDSANGFIEAGRLAPGDAADAARAWCGYNAGPPPANGEVLTRRGEGTGQLALDNRSGQPAVVKLRAPDGAVLASVFLNPNGQATLDGVPTGSVRVDFATGEVWSRACRGFAASMRARRLSDPVATLALGRLAIPPPADVPVTDMTDHAFVQD